MRDVMKAATSDRTICEGDNKTRNVDQKFD